MYVCICFCGNCGLTLDCFAAEERMGQRQELRKSLLRQLCDGGRTIEDMRDEELKNLIVDDKHGIIYCYIPKVPFTSVPSPSSDVSIQNINKVIRVICFIAS